MSTGKGYIKLYRDIWDHWLWKDRPFSRGQAWIDLIMMMNHDDNKTLFMGKLILVKKGSKITSIRQLAERWGWSKMKVSRFLDVLESDNMLIQKRDSKKTLITLIKYEDYQSSKSKGGTVNGHSRDTQKTLTGNRRETDGNKQDIKEGIIEDIIKKEEESEQEISDEQAREWGWID